MGNDSEDDLYDSGLPLDFYDHVPLPSPRPAPPSSSTSRTASATIAHPATSSTHSFVPRSTAAPPPATGGGNSEPVSRLSSTKSPSSTPQPTASGPIKRPVGRPRVRPKPAEPAQKRPVGRPRLTHQELEERARTAAAVAAQAEQERVQNVQEAEKVRGEARRQRDEVAAEAAQLHPDKYPLLDELKRRGKEREAQFGKATTQRSLSDMLATSLSPALPAHKVQQSHPASSLPPSSTIPTAPSASQTAPTSSAYASSTPPIPTAPPPNSTARPLPQSAIRLAGSASSAASADPFQNYIFGNGDVGDNNNDEDEPLNYDGEEGAAEGRWQHPPWLRTAAERAKKLANLQKVYISRAPATISKSKSSASSRTLKPSLLGLKQQQTKSKKSSHKARDADARERLDKGGMELREALHSQDKKPLVKKKEVPTELARGGDPLAQSLDDLSMAFGAA
ncbi:hypothetical protein JCM11641_005809 [Rhodosporidiobolus odoratus]